MKTQRGFTLLQISILLIGLAGLGGWVANLVKLAHLLDGSISAMFIARIVGIFVAPMGAVLGFF